MFTPKTQRAAIVALVLLAVVLLAYSRLSASRSAPQPENRAVHYSVLRANKAIAKGTTITANDIAVTQRSAPPARNYLSNLTDALGRVATHAIVANEVLTQSNTADVPKAVSLADVVPHGLRAISFRVSDEAGVANLIEPGDHVDVLIVSNNKHRARTGGSLFPPAEVKTLVQNVPVLAVDQSLDHDTSSKHGSRDVTLAVTPDQAAVVALIPTIGRQYLLLRRKGDDKVTTAANVTTADLGLTLASSDEPTSGNRRSTRHRLEVIRGAAPAVSVSSAGGTP